MASAPALAVESIELPKPLDPIDEILKSAVSEREQVSLLAYRFWEERGRESGSAHEDWLRAEQVLRARRSQLVRSG